MSTNVQEAIKLLRKSSMFSKVTDEELMQNISLLIKKNSEDKPFEFYKNVEGYHSRIVSLRSVVLKYMSEKDIKLFFETVGF